MDDRFFSSRLRLSGGRTSFLYPAPSRVETSNPASEMLLNWYVAQWDHTTSRHSDTYPSMRIGETNIPSDLRWGQSKVSTRRHWKLPTNIYPTRPTLYRLSQDFNALTSQFSTNIYPADTQSWMELQHSWHCATLLGQPLRTSVTATPTYGIEPKAQHKMPVSNSTLRDLSPRCLDGLSWMLPLPLLNVSQSRCVARLLQSWDHRHFLYTHQRHTPCTFPSLVRTKANTDLRATIQT